VLKRILLVLALLVVLVVIAAVVAWIYIDHLAAVALTSGIKHIGEVDCTVRDTSVSLLTGRIRIDDLVIKNPKGYTDGEMFAVKRAKLKVRLGSLWNQPVHVLHLEVTAPVVNVQAGPGGANVRVFMENVRRKLPTEPEKPPTRMVIDKLVIEQATVRIGSGITGRELVEVALSEPIELTGIRGKDGKGVTSGELAAIILLDLVYRGTLKGNVDFTALLPPELILGLRTVLITTTTVLNGTTDIFTAPLETIFKSILSPRKKPPARPDTP